MLLGTLAACTTTDDDSTTTLYDDAAIVTFKLGTMNRYVDGVKSTYSGSSYAFHIDQLSRTIYNTDSLPVGTDVEHVVCTLGTVNNSMPFIIDLDGEYMTYYTGTDSIDFTTTLAIPNIPSRSTYTKRTPTPLYGRRWPTSPP